LQGLNTRRNLNNWRNSMQAPTGSESRSSHTTVFLFFPELVHEDKSLP